MGVGGCGVRGRWGEGCRMNRKAVVVRGSEIIEQVVVTQTDFARFFMFCLFAKHGNNK